MGGCPFPFTFLLFPATDPEGAPPPIIIDELRIDDGDNTDSTIDAAAAAAVDDEGDSGSPPVGEVGLSDDC